MAGRMEGQPVVIGKVLSVRTRRRSADLTPRELVSRLLFARKGSGKAVTYSDYCAARRGVPDINSFAFGELVSTCEEDPGFSWREHFFRPSLRDSSGRTYEVLERLPDRINLLRDDGRTGFTTSEEFGIFFTPIDDLED